METTIRNLDEDAFRRLKARAASEGKTIGEALNEAMRAYTMGQLPFERKRSILDSKGADFGKGTERLSEGGARPLNHRHSDRYHRHLK